MPDLNHDVLLVVLSFLPLRRYALPLLQSSRTLHELVLPFLLRKVQLENPLSIAQFHDIRTVVPFTASGPLSLSSPSISTYAQRVRDLEIGLGDETFGVLDPDLSTQMTDILCDCSNLSTLYLDGTEAVFKALVERDVQLPCLVSLSLSNFNYDDPNLSPLALDWLGRLQAPLSEVSLVCSDTFSARRIFNALATFTGTLKSLRLSDAHIPVNVGELPSWPAVRELFLYNCFVSVSTLELAFPNVDRLQVYEEDDEEDDSPEYEGLRAQNLAHGCLKWPTLSHVKGDIPGLDLYVLRGCRVDHLELSASTGFYLADISTDTLRNLQPQSLSMHLKLNDDKTLQHLSAVPRLARLQLWLYPSGRGEVAVVEVFDFLSRLHERLKALGALHVLRLSVERGWGPSLSLAEQRGYMDTLLEQMANLESVELEWPTVGWERRVVSRANV